MRIKRAMLFMMTSVLLTLLITPLRGYGYGMKGSSLVGFTLYFIFTVWGIRKSAHSLSSVQITLAIIAGLFLIQLPIRLRFFSSSLVSFPDFVLHFLGILFGFTFAKLPNLQRWLTTSLGFSLAIFMFFRGYDLWLHRLNYGTFSGRVAYALPAKFEAFDENKKLITETDFTTKVVLLDFWFTRCGACFQKFPKLQRFYEKHKNNKEIQIFAVDSPIDDDKEGDAFKVIKDEGHSFPVLITKDAALAEKYGVKGFPTTFVIDQHGTIVFRGDIERATELAEELMKAS